MADADLTDGSDTETERGWFEQNRTNGANLAEPIGTVARSGQLGAPLGIAHLALGAVTAAMSAYGPGGRAGKGGDGDGLPRVRMLSCLHALFTQLHDPEGQEEGAEGSENGRSASSRSPLEHGELDVLEKAVRILHLRYRSCLRPLTKGRLPSRTELKELRLSAEALGVRAAVLCLDKVPKGDPRRLPLFAFRAFALRAELDAEALRGLEEPTSPEWDVAGYEVSTTRLEDLLEDMAEEVLALWNSSNRTVFEVAVLLAPVLAQYALLGKAVAMALEQYRARLTVRKHGRVIPAVGDEIILWDDGLDEVRELFHGGGPDHNPRGGGGPLDDRPLGPVIRIDSMQDYSWFVSWTGASPVNSIPSEVSVKKLLHSIGAPSSRMAGLRAGDKVLLMNASLPDLRAEAERRIGLQLQWAVDVGVKLELRPGRIPGQVIPQQHVQESVPMPLPAAGGGGGGAAQAAFPRSESSSSSNVGSNAGGGGGGSSSGGSSGTGAGVAAAAGAATGISRGKKGPVGGVQQRKNFERHKVETVYEAPHAEEQGEPAQLLKYEDIVEATRDWADDMKLGEGGSAVVYKGIGPDGQLWAVKRGKKGGLTRLKDYEKEIEAVSTMNHPNLVRLLGFCDENDEQVLVYEYVSNGTLRDHLAPLQGEAGSDLSFEKRLDIAIGVAEALFYLHSSNPTLVHRDIKTLNVFMDDEFRPKLGDFGSLKHIGDDLGSQTLTRVVGTPGYLDPQYCQTSIVSDRSDVYSFGVVMLELITGKPPVMKEGEDGTGERMALAKWATPAICSGNADAVVDPRLGHNFPPQALQSLASLAAMCVQRQPKDRPNMGEVTRRLKTIRSQMVAAAAGSANLRGNVHARAMKHGRQQQQQQQQAQLQHQQQQYQGGASPSIPSTPESPHMSGGQQQQQRQGGGSLFTKDFWRPKRAPTRSLSDASMQEISDYLDDDEDGNGPPGQGMGSSSPYHHHPHHHHHHQAPLPRSNLSPFRSGSSSTTSGGGYTSSGGGGNSGPMTPPGYSGGVPPLPHSGSMLAQPSMIPKSKSAEVSGVFHSRSSSTAGNSGPLAVLLQQQQGAQQGGGGQVVAPQAQGQQAAMDPRRFGRKGSKLKDAMTILLKLQHSNVAPVLGLASERDELSPLVYDVPQDCTPLENYLFPDDAEDGDVLPLRVRLKVAVGIARGLGYLHANGVTHGSLTSSNIFLDKNFSVLLVGYGLSTIQQANKGSSKKNLRHTETMAKDTFDYGVVLFELLTGRRRTAAVLPNGAEYSAEDLAEWAEPFIEELEASMNCMEPTKRMVLRMLDVLAKECVQDDPHCRPSVADLMVRLRGLQESLMAQ